MRFKLRLAVCFSMIGLTLTGQGIHAGDISFWFNYDASFTTSAGSNLTAAQSDFAFVGTYISSLVKTGFTGNAVVQINVSGSNDSSSGVLANAGGYANGNDGFEKSFTQLLVQDNIKNTFSFPEAFSTINFDWNWGYGGSTTSTEIDFRYVLLHEMFHALGFESVIDASGASPYGKSYNHFDQYVQAWDGSKYVNLVDRDSSNIPTGVIANAANAVVDSTHPLLFDGPNVRAYLNAGAELYTPAAFEAGASISHYNYPGQVGYFQFGYGSKNFGFSGLDQAFLKDLGYTVVPEPGTYVLSFASMILLAGARRKS
jgi:hypothetical protein